MQIIKIGGNIIDDAEQLRAFLRAFHDINDAKILVHGGGKRATQISRQLGITPQLIDGRRITSDADLDIAIMVYAGLINKQIVAQLQALGTNAAGLSGADGNIIRATRRPAGAIDFGYVGDVQSVNGLFLQQLIMAGVVPVICPLSHDMQGQLLNTNADTIAAEVAIAMSPYSETELVYCFEQAGVLEDIHNSGSVIAQLNYPRYQALLEEGRIQGGMQPKLANCFYALQHGVRRVRIIGAHALNAPLHTGTTITL